MESDEDIEDVAEEQPKVDEVEDEDEIIESDIELEGETVEPDNDPPQKVFFFFFFFFRFWIFIFVVGDDLSVIAFGLFA